MAAWGDPFRYWPVPTWRMWRVEVWWFLPGGKGPGGRYWMRDAYYYMVTLSELPSLYKRVFETGGLYQHRRLVLSSWTWAYDEPQWAEEDHM